MIDPCPRCNGRGSYLYDESHGKICEVCCPHDQGWWQLLEHYGENNGRWACWRGCGYLKPEPHRRSAKIEPVEISGSDAGEPNDPPPGGLERERNRPPPPASGTVDITARHSELLSYKNLLASNSKLAGENARLRQGLADIANSMAAYTQAANTHVDAICIGTKNAIREILK